MNDALLNKLRRVAIANREGTSHTPFDERDDQSIRDHIISKRLMGWTDQELESYLRLTEEINPNIQEGPALEQMGIIRERVHNRLAQK